MISKSLSRVQLFHQFLYGFFRRIANDITALHILFHMQVTKNCQKIGENLKMYFQQ